jgi:phosphate uptake regulator
MESDARNMYIQTLIDESKASLELAIHRMHSISQSMCRDALNSLQNRDAMLAKTVSSLDDDVDHFCFFLIRLLRDVAQDSVLANQLGLELLDCMDHQTLVYKVEHAADHAANIANHVIMVDGSKLKIPDDLLALMFTAGTVATDLYDKAVNAFFSKDVAVSDDILEQQRSVDKMDREIASKAFMGEQKSPQMICAICSLRDSILRVAESAADIAEMAINRAFKITA